LINAVLSPYPKDIIGWNDRLVARNRCSRNGIWWTQIGLEESINTMLELTGIEPATSWLQTMRSPELKLPVQSWQRSWKICIT